MDNRPSKKVYAVTEREDQEGVRRTYWTTIGTAHVNKDETISVRLDGLPLSGVLQIRDEEDARRNSGKPAPMLHDLEAAVVEAAMAWHVADRDRPWSTDRPRDDEHNRARAAVHMACLAINKRRGGGVEARLTRVEAATIGTQQPPPAPHTDVDAEELRLLRLVADVAGRWADDGDHYTELDKAVEALRMYRASRTPLLGFVDALPKGGA